jgi:F-type H+-transporting ATPase subunit b
VLVASSSGSTTNFIVPNGTFIVELVIFVVVLGVIAKFILPALRKVLDERDKTVTDAQRASDAARAEAARLDEERAAVLANARAETRTILEQASRSVDDLIEEAQARGQAEFDLRLATAAVVIEDERRRVHDAVMAGAVDLVVAAAERIVGDGVDAEHHRDAIAAELAGAHAPVNGE